MHAAYILEVDVAALIREEIDLIRQVDTIAIWFVVVECLLRHMASEALPTNELSAMGQREVRGES